MITKATYVGVVLAAVIAAGASRAAEASEGWDVTISPYLWAAGIDGKVDIGPTSSNFNASFDDILKHLDFNMAGILEVNNGRWVNWAQIDYLQLENNDANVGPIPADLNSDITMLAFGTGYRFNTSTRSTLDVLLGMRYLNVDSRLKLSGVGSATGDAHSTDAIVTLRPRLRFSDHWALSPTISIGTGDSHLVWETSPQLLYTISDKLDVRFGYRKLSYDFTDGNNELDFTIAGLIAGVGYTF